MSFLSRTGLVALLLLLTSACKTPQSEESTVKDATAAHCSATVNFVEVPGVGYLGGFYANQGQGKVEVKKLDKTTWDVCAAAGNAFLHELGSGSGGGITVTIDGVKTALSRNPLANYGYLNENVKCGAVGKFFGLNFDSTQIDKNCEIQFDTEDQSWFAATISPEWLQTEKGYDENTDTVNKVFLDQVMKKQIADGKGSSMDKPLAPRQINANLDDRVLGAMEKIQKKYQANSGSSLTEANRERNTCLRNGRAHSWLDIQAHFYCILPYRTRQCYSTGLVKKTQGINNITDPQQKLGVLLNAMNTSYADCFDPGKPFEFKKDFPNDGDEISAAFKYVMFVRQGVMDFNIDSSNELIEKFYAGVKDTGTPKRPSRLLDPQPWNPKQKRYAEVRQSQASAIRLGIAKGQCAAGGGTWNDASNQCGCPANESWNGATNKCEGAAVPGWQKFLESDNYGTAENAKAWSGFVDQTDIPTLMQDKAVYANTRATKFEDAKKLYQVPAKSLLKAMKDAEGKYDSAGGNLAARNNCLKARSLTSYLSDLQIHYICQHYQPRECYTASLVSKRDRLKAFAACSDDTKSDPAAASTVNDYVSFRWISKEQSRANMFQYIMNANTYPFDMEQQQTIVNAFYGVPNPGDFAFLATPEGRVKCQEFRPIRKDEKSVRLKSGMTPLEFAKTSAGADFGGHCIPAKKWKTSLKGRGY